MNSAGFASLLFAGLLMGMLHAFDPDHILTLSSLGARPGARSETRRYAMSWGIGHGGILVIAALLLLWLDLPLPAALPQGAERMVGIIMIAAGGSLAHALWRTGDFAHAPSPIREKAPILIGMVHGTAGSAALFALLPIGLLSPAQGLVYVLIFSVGVLGGMMGFGLGFDRLSRIIVTRAHGFDKPLRACVAALAISIGSYWLVSA